MDIDLVFSVVGVAVTLGGLAVGFGVLRQKIIDNGESNKEQQKKLDECVNHKELASAVARSEGRGDGKLADAIKHSDELLVLMQRRAEEDRVRGEGRYKELYGIINAHGERIAKVESSQGQIFKMLDKLEGTVSAGFRDMRNELKEVRADIARGGNGGV